MQVSVNGGTNKNDFRLLTDSRGRISLGKLHNKDATSYRGFLDDEGRVILEPCIDVPISPKWLDDNITSKKEVLQALEDVKARRVTKLDEF